VACANGGVNCFGYGWSIHLSLYSEKDRRAIVPGADAISIHFASSLKRDGKDQRSQTFGWVDCAYRYAHCSAGTLHGVPEE